MCQCLHAKVRQRSIVAVLAAQLVEHRACHRSTRLGAGVLELGCLGVGGQRKHEDALAVLAGAGQHRVEAAEAEERCRGDRIHRHRGSGIEVGIGVGLCRGPDVTAFHVEYDERTRLA